MAEYHTHILKVSVNHFKCEAANIFKCEAANIT